MRVEADKIGSATVPVSLARAAEVDGTRKTAFVGDVVAAKALTESITYGNLELPSGRLAKINAGDVIFGVLGKRRALKGFVGDVPETVAGGDRLHLLNMGGVIGKCEGHHSSLSDAIELEVIGTVVDGLGLSVNIADGAIRDDAGTGSDVPLIVVAGSCMNSGKTVAAVEIIKQAARAGWRVAGAKLTGVACLRDTLNMKDHGAFATASFLDCGLPSTVDNGDLPGVAGRILNHLASLRPEMIVAELGDGIIGGYGVESILADAKFRRSVSSFVFCAPDYVALTGGVHFLRELGITIDVVAGSVTDSRMGEEFITQRFGLAAGNARRDGEKLFELVLASLPAEAAFA